MNSIKALLDALSKRESSSMVFNPYGDRALVANLRCYLRYMSRLQGPRVLLVGEAPGFRGARFTGIPFSSGAVFQRTDHPMFEAIGRKLVLKKIATEPTASIVWNYLADKSVTPLFWNAYPFHPHRRDDPDSNRAPGAAEVKEGEKYLVAVGSIYEPDIIGGIGNKGFQAACRVFPHRPIVKIRHPSFGGKTQFIEGMDALL